MKKYLNLFCSCLLAVVMASCGAEDVESPTQVDGNLIYRMELRGGVTDYGEASTRATKTWSSGDKLYLLFTSGNTTVKGVATFNGNIWEMKPEAPLTGSGTCKVVEVDNPVSTQTEGRITANSASVIYRDASATWSVSGYMFLVNVDLKPYYGRLRFKGSSGVSFKLAGMSVPDYVDLSTGEVYSKVDTISTSIQSDGYSPYIYGKFADSTNPSLNIGAYTMPCPNTMLKAGDSGWLNYPTHKTHTGWRFDGDAATNGYEFVDLGLSVKWATCNVGAEVPEGYGDYFAWGETEPNEYYSWNYYKLCNGSYSSITKYCTSSSYGTVDNKTTLELEDDAAHVNWGGEWRMPTLAELQELNNSCSKTWTTLNGVNGCRFTAPNGNSIFVPAAGYMSGSSYNSRGSYGYIQSSTLESSRYNYYLYCYSSGRGTTNDYRYYGRAVRAVLP